MTVIRTTISLSIVLIHWGLTNMAAIMQTAYQMFFYQEFRFKFHSNLFLDVRPTVSHQWFGYRLGTIKAAGHYLNHWWQRSVTSYGVTILQSVTVDKMGYKSQPMGSHATKSFSCNSNSMLFWKPRVVNFVVTVGTAECCPNDKSRCHQWRQSGRHGNSWFSVTQCCQRYYTIHVAVALQWRYNEHDGV